MSYPVPTEGYVIALLSVPVVIQTMADELTENYPEAAEYIWKAVDEHGEDWVLEHYYQQLYPLGILLDMPEKDELPFFDPEVHKMMSKEEVTEMYQAWAEYRENLRRGKKPTE